MPYTLLLADDSVTIQRVIELTFVDEDVRVVAVGDGDQAIARLDQQAPDIVLADVGMPGRNGYDIARYVKRQPRLAHIPVLLLTGAFEPIDQVKADQAGCDGVLAKPFEPRAVIKLVTDLLARARAGLPGALPAANELRLAPEDAFVALAGPTTAPPPTVITEDLVERVARRVLEKLSDRVVRETVADVVSTIAERLVRDEIERITGQKR